MNYLVLYDDEGYARIDTENLVKEMTEQKNDFKEEYYVGNK